MAFIDDSIEYADGENDLLFRIKIGTCEFEGYLCERKASGFDLFLRREFSELECLEVDQITWLRHEAKGEDSLFIKHFPETKLTKSVRRGAADALGCWLREKFSLTFDSKSKVRWSDESDF